MAQLGPALQRSGLPVHPPAAQLLSRAAPGSAGGGNEAPVHEQAGAAPGGTSFPPSGRASGRPALSGTTAARSVRPPGASAAKAVEPAESAEELRASNELMRALFRQQVRRRLRAFLLLFSQQVGRCSHVCLSVAVRLGERGWERWDPPSRRRGHAVVGAAVWVSGSRRRFHFGH
jgi:hypothetical protein